MYKKKVALVAMLFIGTALNAQGLLGKIGGGSSSGGTTEYISQDEIAKNWQDGDYGHRMDYSGMWQPQGKKPIKFNRDAAGEVESIEVNGQKFERNKGTTSSFVKSYSTSSNDILYLTADCIVKYRLSGSSVFPEDVWGDKMSQGAAKKEIAEFREFADKTIEEQKKAYSDNLKEENAKKEAERKAKFSIEGKDVSKVEIINIVTPEKFGHYTGFTFDIQATLKDGTVISTKESNQGYMSDYEISYDKANYNYGKLEKGFLSDDKIKITIKSKYNPALTDSKDVVVLYNQDISNKWNGTSWSRGAGESAMNFKIEVKQVKHKVNGSDLLQVRITNVSTSEIIDEYKIGIDQTLHFYANGGSGGKDDGRGGNGGNGGNITVIKDPNVKYFNLDYSNNAGRGGKGDYSSMDGRDGRDGVYKEEVRAVNF